MNRLNDPGTAQLAERNIRRAMFRDQGYAAIAATVPGAEVQRQPVQEPEPPRSADHHHEPGYGWGV